MWGNGQSVDILGIGACELNFGSEKILPLLGVLYAPDIIYNLLNISSLNNYKLELLFQENKIQVMVELATLVGSLNKCLYITSQSSIASAFLVSDVGFESLKWHS